MPEYHAHSANAHSANDEGQRHGLVEHLRAVAELAREFSSSFGGGETAHYAGLWHDLGKFDPEFQRYLSGSRTRGPDHKGAGTRLACQHVKGGEKVYHCGTFCRRRLQMTKQSLESTRSQLSAPPNATLSRPRQECHDLNNVWLRPSQRGRPRQPERGDSDRIVLQPQYPLGVHLIRTNDWGVSSPGRDERL